MDEIRKNDTNDTNDNDVSFVLAREILRLVNGKTINQVKMAVDRVLIYLNNSTPIVLEFHQE